MSSRKFTRALLVSTMLCGGVAAPAFAQDAPVRQSVDANGVDLFLGTLRLETPAVTIGGDQGLSYKWIWIGAGFGDSFNIRLTGNSSAVTVILGKESDSFTASGSTFTSTEGNGATMSYDGSDTYTYTRSDGTRILFSNALSNSLSIIAQPVLMTSPSGQRLTFNYETQVFCSRVKVTAGDNICLTETSQHRMANVTSNYGYRIGFDYIDTDLQYWPPVNAANWLTRLGGRAFNLAAPAGSGTAALGVNIVPSGGYSYFPVTDPLGRVTTYRTNGPQMLGIKLPGSTSEDITFTYSGSRVSSITTPAGTVNYAASDAAGLRTVTVTDQLSHTTTYVFDIALQRMKSVTDALGHTTNYDYDSKGRRTRVTQHEGNYIQTTYQSTTRDNVIQTDVVAKSGSGVATITTSASFDASCTNPVTCNQPNSTTDAKGNVTNYTYDTTSGDVLTVTSPAPTTGATRPKTTYSYSSLSAYYNVSGSGIVASGQPVRRLTSVSTCQTTSSCVGTADEIKTVISYGPQTTGVGNNLLPVSVSKGNGNGTLTAITGVSYDVIGNVTGVDGPLAGTADTTTYRYDAARQIVGVISPDPDGGGALKRRAQKATYNSHGIATAVELGTVNGTSDGDWAAFVSAQKVTTTLDTADRKVLDVLTASGTAYQVTQYSYDAAGRLDCTALRMNSATWTSLPSSACTLATTGTAGPDRIRKTTYDVVNRPTLVQTAYGTADQADEVATSYTNNGKTASVTDGQGNKTTYEYDGIDRLSKTRYPTAAAGSGTSSTTDYEQLVYDANSNVTSRRLRGYAADSTQHIDFTYDNLNRATLKDLPGSEPDVAYTYDLQNRLITASRTADGVSHTLAYDALGRVTSETQPFGSMSYQYDLAGNRTLQMWNDGFYVTYDHLVTGQVAAIRENGAASGIGVLVSYSYDNLGRRTGITRGNGTTTSYGIDAASRLSSLGHDLASTAYDLNLGFTYNNASQIAGTTRSNNAYAYGGSANVDRAYTVNGLNQATLVGGGSVGYDARGNLTSAGSNTYTFNSQNLLIGASGGTSIYYDAFNRLTEYDTSVSTRFVYDGSHMAAEVANPSGVVTRRYVFGPGDDEPIVWYEGSGTSDRRWLHADERGSVVAVTNGSGIVVGSNSYDEYGVPGSGNIGIFQYTGQAYLSGIGLYYYKARIYSSRIGRFMQADPIGYDDGLNIYNYVGGDPINATDPFGLFCANGDSGGNDSDCAGKGGWVADTPYDRPPEKEIIVGGGHGNGGDGGLAVPGVVSSPGGLGHEPVDSGGADTGGPQKDKPPKIDPKKDQEETCKFLNSVSRLGTVIGFTGVFNAGGFANAVRLVGPKLAADLVPGAGEVAGAIQLGATAAGVAATLGQFILDCN